MNSQREAFEKQYCENSGITVSEYRKEYVTLPCQCPEEDCPGWAVVRATPLSIKTHVDLYAPDWQAATEQGVGEAVAWYNPEIDSVITAKTYNQTRNGSILGYTTPLYTHPLKPTGGGVPEGHVIAPIEPTDDMVYASNPDQAPSEARESRQIIKAALSILATQQPPEQD